MSGITTKRIVDKRIEPQPAPVYATTIGPIQNQFYKIPASGLSNSYITFNNLTTLGADRAYLDTFELEITAKIRFEFTDASLQAVHTCTDGANQPLYHAAEKSLWTFDSFPFNKCCEETRVNINGGAFFSSPLSYLRAKERYWDEKQINDSYEGICPCHKANMQNETGLRYDDSCFVRDVSITYAGVTTNLTADTCVSGILLKNALSGRFPNRLQEMTGNAPSASGVNSQPNNAMVPGFLVDETAHYAEVSVTWREPIFASPFSSKIDANYGRPLYNITSIDIAFNMQDLRNMILCIDPCVTNYTVNFENINLCYQVETVPLDLVPSSTIVPYRRFVPYITDYKGPSIQGTDRSLSIKSGVYTLNEVPTAIWIFAGPSKKMLQTYNRDTYTMLNAANQQIQYTLPNSYNKTFGFITGLSLTMANTTQILSTATPADLFRICKANGLQDDFRSWGSSKYQRNFPKVPCVIGESTPTSEAVINIKNYDEGYCPGIGSVIRLIPGTDIVIPDQPLIPGANANNLVFTVEANFVMPTVPVEYEDNFSLWLLFEYVGVASITAGQCEITMNPLGNGSIMNAAPVQSESLTEPPSTVEGSGWLDTIKQVGGLIKNSGIVSNALSAIPGIGGIASGVAKNMGWGDKGMKRARGGAVMGLGDFC